MDELVVGLVTLVVGTLLLGLGKWRTIILRRLRERRRLVKEEEKLREERKLERRQLAKHLHQPEEERQRCLQLFASSAGN